MDERVTIEQVSKWLLAWAVDQSYIASRQGKGSQRQYEFEMRAVALADASRDILKADIWDLGGFMDKDGKYPERTTHG